MIGSMSPRAARPKRLILHCRQRRGCHETHEFIEFGDFARLVQSAWAERVSELFTTPSSTLPVLLCSVPGRWRIQDRRGHRGGARRASSFEGPGQHPRLLSQAPRARWCSGWRFESRQSHRGAHDHPRTLRSSSTGRPSRSPVASLCEVQPPLRTPELHWVGAHSARPIPVKRENTDGHSLGVRQRQRDSRFGRVLALAESCLPSTRRCTGFEVMGAWG
jgi:hypothetical protein